jgi:Na+/H+ antiporter NhaD/arsenite permease-like protein
MGKGEGKGGRQAHQPAKPGIKLAISKRGLKMALIKAFYIACIVFLPSCAFGAEAHAAPALAGIRIEFVLFALTLVGVALFHRHTMYVALTGLVCIIGFKYLFIDGFSLFGHISGHGQEEGEWRIILNLIGLLFGFAILAKHFEESRLPDVLPNFLPDDWKGGFVLLCLIFVLSSFLDNIAAAMIGGTIARAVFKGKVHIGFLAAIIAASNAGGAGSVIGDTTTTLMWIDGVSALQVVHAFVASAAALAVFGIAGALQQDRHQTIIKSASKGIAIDYGKLFIVFLILVGAITTNYLLDFPAVGVWVGIILGAMIRKTPWYEMGHAWMGTIFLTALVTCASLMPVEQLPAASWQTACSFGFISAVFDNIPLTKLCLDQGGYDWGVLAYTVGFGGSMIWFGSSAGVALSNQYPEIRSVAVYLRHGWHVIIAYIVGFIVLLLLLGWHPAPKKSDLQNTQIPTATQSGHKMVQSYNMLEGLEKE